VINDDLVRKKNKSVVQTKDILINGWNVGDDKLGKVDTWSPRDVLVFDTLTFLGQAALRGACLANGINREDDKGIPQPVWGLAQNAVMAAVEHVCGPNVKCSVIFNTHLKFMEDDRTKMVKAYPNVLGSALSPTIGQHFTDVWSIDVKHDGKRVIRTQSNNMISLKNSDPAHVKAEEEFDLGALFNRLIPPVAAAA
jgi:hypothetical protein